MRAVLLDRDGTIVIDKEHMLFPEQIELQPGAAQRIKAINQAGWAVVIVSNQSVVGRGMMPNEGVKAMMDRTVELLNLWDAHVDYAIWCPHKPEDNCFCRKPKPGLLYRAAVKLKLDLRECLMIGDSLTDMQAAKAANCPRFKVSTERGLADWNPMQLLVQGRRR